MALCVEYFVCANRFTCYVLHICACVYVCLKANYKYFCRWDVLQAVLSQTSHLGPTYVVNFKNNYKDHQAILLFLLLLLLLLPIQIY